MLFTASVVLDVTVDLSVYCTNEKYYSAYEDASAREVLQKKIKENVSVVFRHESFLFVFSIHVLVLFEFMFKTKALFT